MAKIYVLHENDSWVEPLRRAFLRQELPYEEWFLDEGTVDLGALPPQGVFYNRMSASSYTRNHRYGPELTAVALGWLENHGRRVVNKGRALAIEISKAAQYAALKAAGIRTPRTAAAVGRQALLETAKRFAPGPLILKPNRGGKGHGVRLFHTLAALEQHVASAEFEPAVDGVYLIQEYIRSPEPFITRAEFIGGRFFYAVRVDTSEGFELCPADACQVGDAFCPAGETPKPRFSIVDSIDATLRDSYASFLAANDIEVAGIEFITDGKGRPYTYDVNTNTNYNAEAETRVGRFGMEELASFLGRELRAVEKARPAPLRLAG